MYWLCYICSCLSKCYGSILSSHTAALKGEQLFIKLKYLVLILKKSHIYQLYCQIYKCTCS